METLKAFQCFSIQECLVFCCCLSGYWAVNTAAGGNSLAHLCFSKADLIESLRWTKRCELEERVKRKRRKWESLLTAGTGLSGWDSHSLEGWMYTGYIRVALGPVDEQHHDLSWFIRCGVRCGATGFLRPQTCPLTLSTRTHRAPDWDTEPDAAMPLLRISYFSGFWSLVFLLFFTFLFWWMDFNEYP